MRKLLYANGSRLMKSVVFRWMILCCFLLGSVTYLLVAVYTRNLGRGWLEYNAHALFYLFSLYQPVTIAIFTCFFFGTEYSDGAIRNKLTVGHSREAIYGCNFLTTIIAALLFGFAGLLPVFLVGIPFSGTAVITCVELQPWRLLQVLLVQVEYSALLVLLAMMDSNKARNVLISLLTVGALILLGMAAYKSFSQPEFIPYVTALPGGSLDIQDGPPNSKYLTGIPRMVVHGISMLLPTGSLSLSIDKKYGFSWAVPMTTLLTSGLLTWAGIRLFQKKDLK